MVQTCTQTQAINSIKESFKKTLPRDLKQTTVEKCDVILHFCLIASRAGTDLIAAVNQLDSLQVSKPAILVVLHHTFDPEKMIPDSSIVVNRETIQTVDCLFNEDVGLMQCQKNENAFKKVAEYVNSEKRTSYACLKEDYAGLHPSTDYFTSLYGSTVRLTHSEDSLGQKVLQILNHWLCWIFIGSVLLLALLLVVFSCTKLI